MNEMNENVELSENDEMKWERWDENDEMSSEHEITLNFRIVAK
jgi:hypothetical protein